MYIEYLLQGDMRNLSSCDILLMNSLRIRPTDTLTAPIFSEDLAVNFLVLLRVVAFPSILGIAAVAGNFLTNC